MDLRWEISVSYYLGAFCRALQQAWVWPNSHSYWFLFLTTVLGGLFTVAVVKTLSLGKVKQPPLLYWAEKFSATVLMGAILTFLGSIVVFFIQDAPRQIAERDERIAELGGAPDAPIDILSSIKHSLQVRRTVDDLSMLINNDLTDVCNEAKSALKCVSDIRTEQPQDCLAKIDLAFNNGRRLMTKLRSGTGEGMLVRGDAQLLFVLNQALQPKDWQTFVDYDQYSRGTREEVAFLTLLTPEERVRLFEAALKLSDNHNRWAEATDVYCALIKKTNERIAEIRRQISR